MKQFSDFNWNVIFSRQRYPTIYRHPEAIIGLQQEITKCIQTALLSISSLCKNTSDKKSNLDRGIDRTDNFYKLIDSLMDLSKANGDNTPNVEDILGGFYKYSDPDTSNVKSEVSEVLSIKSMFEKKPVKVDEPEKQTIPLTNVVTSNDVDGNEVKQSEQVVRGNLATEDSGQGNIRGELTTEDLVQGNVGDELTTEDLMKGNVGAEDSVQENVGFIKKLIENSLRDNITDHSSKTNEVDRIADQSTIESCQTNSSKKKKKPAK